VQGGFVKNRRIVIRADADQTIGIGHVGRTLALADAWRRGGGEVQYVTTRPLASQAETWIRSSGHALHMFDVVRYSDEDAARTVAAAEGAPLVLDAYGTPLDYRSALRRARRLAIIDDLGGPGPWHADLIVNVNHGATTALYPEREPATSLLLGPGYALLRPEFQRWRERRRSRDGGERIAVSFGGADPADTSSRALAALTTLPGSDWRAVLAAGSANPLADELRRRARASGRPIHVLRRPSSMARLLAWADIALLAGGSTVWEAFCLGVPVIGIAVAGNQAPAAETLGSGRRWHYLGRTEEVGEPAMRDAIMRLRSDPGERRRLSEAGRALVDGKGAERLAEALRRLES
jgi:UDP-2,4-diacetamido-2,4,6-trideoxy-beta-L-altropyranose hydrolase